MNTVTWIQHPIGQGGFHSGQMVDKDGARFNWIFDCGAKNNRRFSDYLVRWTSQHNEPVDWLFISHFDFDHVSGLETLTSRCVIRNVMVPYVNEEELVYALLTEIARGNLVRAFVELTADPGGFFLSRGARRVVFLNGGSPREPGEREDREPIEPPEGPTAGMEDDRWKTRISKPIEPIVAPGLVHSAVEPSSLGTINGGACAVTISSSSVSLRLIPYRAPIVQPAHNQLLAEVRRLVGLVSYSSVGRPGLQGLAYAIALHARTKIGRAELQALHKKYVGSSNRASLSLLSQPQNFDPARAYCHINHPFRHFSRKNENAWINTGDAELLSPADLIDWKNCYSGFVADVAVLALPHHGSDKNSDGNLQTLCPNAILTAHVKSTSRKHPGALVSATAGRRLACVTEKNITKIFMRFDCY